MNTLFFPKSIAVFGVSETKNNFGRNIVRNLLDFQFTGEIYAIGKEEGSVYDLPIHTSILDVPGDVESAVFLVPAKFIPPMLEECGQKGVKRAVISSGGFSELSDERHDLEKQVTDIANKYGIRFIGPNCLGVINQDIGMCLPFVRMNRFPTGPVALLTQSGGVGLSLINLFTGHNLGINKYVSLGNKLNINEADIIRFLETDKSTGSICLYLEEIEKGRDFIDAVRSITKPVIVYKANTTAEGAKTAASHTAAISNDDAVVDAAFRQSGAIRIHDMMELPSVCQVFKLPPMKGNRIALITPTGGHAVIAADECERLGFTLPPFPDSFIKQVEKHVRAGVIKLKNPLDLGDMFDFELMYALITRTLDEDNFDALVLSYIFLTTFPVPMISNIFPLLENVMRKYNKPILLCVSGNPNEINTIRASSTFPIFDSPDQIIRALAMLRDHSMNVQYRQHKPEIPQIDANSINKIIDNALAAGKKELTSEAMQILRHCGFKLVPEKLVSTSVEAAAAAAEMGFPVALKISSPDILHKTEAGGVALGLDSNDSVKTAFNAIIASAKELFPAARIEGITVQKMVSGKREMLLGVNYNEQFGHTIVFGLGGIFVEALKDITMRIAPITRHDAEEMLGEIRATKLLGNFRNMKETDREELVMLLLKLSSLVTSCPRIRELDINPLLIPTEGTPCYAVDARAVICE